jgi:hypothetical protein
MRWDEMKWDEVRWGEMRWNHLRRHEMRWNEMRWGELRWGKNTWEETTWDEMRWNAMRLDKIRKVAMRRAEVRGGEFRWNETRWNVGRGGRGVKCQELKDCCCETQKLCPHLIGTSFVRLQAISCLKIPPPACLPGCCLQPTHITNTIEFSRAVTSQSDFIGSLDGFSH